MRIGFSAATRMSGCQSGDANLVIVRLEQWTTADSQRHKEFPGRHVVHAADSRVFLHKGTQTVAGFDVTS